MTAWTWVRGTRPRAERSGAAMGWPTTRWTFTGRTNFDPLGMAWAVPPMPMGTMAAPVRAARKAAPSCRSSTTGPARRRALGEQDEHVAALEHVLGPLEGQAVRRVAVDGEGADGVEEGPEQR